jgi:thiamine-monophosphate kinase
MGEFERIARFWRPLAAGFPGARNLEDDAAVLTPQAGQELVVTTDAIVEGIHFLGSEPPDQIAQKLLRVNLSDLAAKGANPYAYTLVAALSASIDDAWLAAFAAGLARDQEQFGIALAGGDTVSTTGPVVLSVTAFGTAPSGKTISRKGAQPGDLVYVTGCIGEAFLGLRAQQDKWTHTKEIDAWIARYRLPRPRIGIAPLLLDIATASIDVSDGLVGDLDHICAASGVSASIQASSIPLPDCKGYAEIEDLITGGDDYEIIFTAPPSAAAQMKSYSEINDISITPIGKIENEKDHRTFVYAADGRALTFKKRGWTHGT